MCNYQYIVGILWFIGSLILDNTNDVIMKYVGTGISAYEIIFFRFLFGSILLLPFYLKRTIAATHNPMTLLVHLLRGTILFVGMVIWCEGLKYVNITTATAINFTIPFFVLIFANIFLKEKLSAIKIMATCVGFAGTFIVVHNEDMQLDVSCIVLLISAFLFAILDIINKYLVKSQSKVDLMFFSELTVCTLAILPTVYYWVTPTCLTVLLLGILGITGNLILLCLLQAFSSLDISALAPFRYTEIVVSATFGYFIFQEIPTTTTLIGSVVILTSTMVVTYEGYFKYKGAGTIDN
ncbi:DMT family transporter [Rickettsiales endosymbiont of Peranema trichophorum]|uniref:DMT family transporter n=1 Tax=Rickettsiales endosymbiont of Peranema trichophorum TaxID=2486577 RepID=UPI001022E136|nr:DMT family transporter [Rickettsiales endosymbiont of Peranema trichophorum]RZI47430.1 DMT family transporter [Rickettsiales endosymbiont of Peranema trichophorum]